MALMASVWKNRDYNRGTAEEKEPGNQSSWQNSDVIKFCAVMHRTEELTWEKQKRALGLE